MHGDNLAWLPGQREDGPGGGFVVGGISGNS